MELLNANGIEITAEELDAAVKQAKDGELDENDLDDVAGGGYFGRVILRVVGLILGYTMYKIQSAIRDDIHKKM